MKKLVFVIGGARSGKSSFALKLASGIVGRKAFLATMKPLDDEMKARAEAHGRERGPEWECFEEEVRLPGLLRELDGYGVVLVDCVTLWLSNIMLSGMGVEGESEKLLKALKECGANVFVVSNEVGMGIVPENALARRFRDEAGRLNRLIAGAADEVYAIIAGIPVKIK